MKKFKLPRGAVAIKPRRMKIAGWVKMVFDARVTRYGVVWFRVKDGMVNKGDREDWVANIPACSVSVHDYQWNGETFGVNYGSFDNACFQELKSGLERTERLLAENLQTRACLTKTVSILKKSQRKRGQHE